MLKQGWSWGAKESGASLGDKWGSGRVYCTVGLSSWGVERVWCAGNWGAGGVSRQSGVASWGAGQGLGGMDSWGQLY